MYESLHVWKGIVSNKFTLRIPITRKKRSIPAAVGAYYNTFQRYVYTAMAALVVLYRIRLFFIV